MRRDRPRHPRQGVPPAASPGHFLFEAWLHAEVPRVACTSCGKTTQVSVPCAREGSGFTLLFEAQSLSLYQGLPERQAAQMLRVQDKQLWRRIDFYVSEARRKQNMSAVNDPDAKRLLFDTHGRDCTTVLGFSVDLRAHGGDPTAVAHACMDMSRHTSRVSAPSCPTR